MPKDWENHSLDWCVLQLVRDKERIDWLGDVNQSIGNVQLPTEVVHRNVHSLRDAIDDARGE